MSVRITQSQFYSLLNSNLSANYSKLANLQQQVSSGKRLLRPSDDPGGESIALTLRNSQADVGRYLDAAADARTRLDEAAGLATDANTTLSNVRELVVRGLNDSLGASARTTLANEVEELGKQLLQIANTRSDGGYVFGGTNLSQAPYAETDVNGRKHVVWQGGNSVARATIGSGDAIDTGVTGSQLFSRWAPTGTTYAGLTGAHAGRSSDKGTAYEELTVRHDSTTATLGAGVTLVASGASDTVLGTRTLEVDAATSRVRLGSGAWTSLPDAAGGNRANVVVKDDKGAEVHLDFSAWTGASFSGSVSGSGSVSIDGTNFTSVNFTETDLQLSDATSGAIVHLDTTGLVRSGRDLVSFGGTSSVFDTIQGIADDLRNETGLSNSDIQARLGARLKELDAKHDDVLVGVGTLAAKSARATDVQERLNTRSIDLQGRLENVEDVDLTAAVLDISRTQQTLELVQSTGSRLLRTSLLDYLR